MTQPANYFIHIKLFILSYAFFTSIKFTKVQNCILSLNLNYQISQPFLNKTNN